MKIDFLGANNIFSLISRALGFFSRQSSKGADLIGQYLNRDKYDPELAENRYASLAYNRSLTGLVKNSRKFKKLVDKKLKENKIEMRSDLLVKAHQKREWEFYMGFFSADLKETDAVLDTGAYNMYFSIFMKDYVKKIYTTDNFYWAERGYVKEANLPSPEQWMSQINKIEPGKLTAQEADLMELPFGNDLFDKVFCISTIEHVKDDLKGMEEMYRVLKPGGLLLLTTEINRRLNKPYSETDGSYYRVYSYEQIMELIRKAGFKLAGEDRIMETTGRSGEFCQALFVLRK